MKVSVNGVVRCLLKESAGVSRYLREQEVKYVTAQATPLDVHRTASHVLRPLIAFLLIQLNYIWDCISD